MSNGGLDPTGVEFQVDDSQAGPALRRLDSGLGENARSIRELASVALTAAGTGSQLTGVIGSLIAATGPLDLVFVGLAAAISIANQKLQEQAAVNKQVAYYYDLEAGSIARAAENLSKQLVTQQALNAAVAAQRAVASAGPVISPELSGFLNQRYGNAPTGELTPEQQLQAQQNAKDRILLTDTLTASQIRAAAESAIVQRLAGGLTQTYEDQKQALFDTRDSYDVFISKLSKLEGIDLKQVFVDAASGNATLAASAVSVLAGLDAEYNKIRDIALARIAAGVGTSADFNTVQAGVATDTARSLQKQLLALEAQSNTQIEADNAAHAVRMTQIDQEGVTARAAIARSYGRQLRDIAQAEQDAGVEAARSRAEALVQADIDGARRRADLAGQFEDRRAQINQAANDSRLRNEQTYQDALARINSDYQASYFDAASRNDARALISAQVQRATQLAQAAQTRDRSNADTESQRVKDQAAAKKDYEQQQRALDQNLRDQKAQIEKSYQDAIRRAAEQAARARRDAKQNAADQYADQAAAQAAARQSEIDSNAARLVQLKADLKLRENALVAAAIAEKGISEEYARAIVASLKSILSPDQITRILADIKNALSAKIDVTITPIIVQSPGGAGGPPRYAAGGYTAGYAGPAWIDPHELVLPLGNQARTQQLVRQYAPQLMGGAGANGRAAIKISLDNQLLHATVTQIAGELDIAIEEAVAAGG